MPYLPVDLTNAAASTVGSTLAATDTSLTLTTGGGAVLLAAGSAPFFVRIGASSPYSEVAQVTNIVGDTATLTRGVAGHLGAQAWAVGATVQRVDRASEDALYRAITCLLSVANSAQSLTNGATGPLILHGNTSQSLAASAGTIATAGLSISRVACAASNATGAILAAGTVDGQVVIVENSHATHTITFDVAATSNVADGTSDVIAALTSVAYVWDGTAARWFKVA